MSAALHDPDTSDLVEAADSGVQTEPPAEAAHRICNGLAESRDRILTTALAFYLGDGWLAKARSGRASIAIWGDTRYLFVDHQIVLFTRTEWPSFDNDDAFLSGVAWGPRLKTFFIDRDQERARQLRLLLEQGASR